LTAGRFFPNYSDSTCLDVSFGLH